MLAMTVNVLNGETVLVTDFYHFQKQRDAGTKLEHLEGEGGVGKGFITSSPRSELPHRLL